MLSNDIRNYRALDGLYIAHHGILNMKWGKRNGPPYPLSPGDHSKAEKSAAEKAGVKVGKSSGKGSIENVEPKKKNVIESAVDAYKSHKKKKQQEENLKKAREAAAKKREEAKTAEEREVERKKALESGDYNQIQKYAKESSTKELQDALNRADTLKKLDKAVIDNTPVEPTLQDQINDAASKIQTATNLATNSINAWNKIAQVYNTFSDPDAMLPEIGKNWAEEQDKKRKEAAEKVRKDQVEAIQKRNNPNEILKNRELFTNKEIEEASKRLSNESNIKGYQSDGKHYDEWKAKDNKTDDNSGDGSGKNKDKKNKNETETQSSETKKESTSTSSELDRIMNSDGYKRMKEMDAAIDKMADDALKSGKYHKVYDSILGYRVVKNEPGYKADSVSDDITNYLNKASQKSINNMSSSDDWVYDYLDDLK